MKTRRYRGDDLRRVLQGMVTDQVVCSRIAGQWKDEGLFDSPWANLVGRWCVLHQRKYGVPPNGQLRDIFDEWAGRHPDSVDMVKLVEKFLTHLSEQFESQPEAHSSEYLLDCAGRYFNKVRLRGVIEEATDELDHNQVDSAHGLLSEVNRVELGVGSVVKPAEDYEAWSQAFDREQQRPLIGYPGRLDNFLGRAMTRGKFIAFMGPDKSGKSFWLLDAAYRAVRNRRRVAFFDVGDMTEGDILMRLGSRVARVPHRSPRTVWVPKTVTKGGKVEGENKQFGKLLGASGAYRAFRKVCRGRDIFRLSCHPNSSINLDGLVGILRNWEREGWVADVVVIDYADILAPPVGVRETLDQIDTTWRHLRRLSQEFHCLVLTATQSNAAAYQEKAALSRKHFSGRKTKLAHVNGMIGINVTSDEKEKGVTRLNWVVRREGAFSDQRWMTVAGCLSFSSPAICCGNF